MSAIAILAAAILAPMQEPVNARVELTDGSALMGKVRIPDASIATDFGEFKVPGEAVRSCRFGPSDDLLATRHSLLRGKWAVAELAFTPDGAQEQQLSRGRLRLLTVFRDPPDGDRAIEIPALGSTVVTDTDLRPAAVVELRAKVSDPLLSPDGKWLYFLDRTTGKVRRLDRAKRSLDDAFVAVGAGAEGLAMSPNGKNLYAFTREQTGKGFGGSPFTGRILPITAETLKPRAVVTLDFGPEGLQAADSGLLYATSHPEADLSVIDPSSKKVVGRLPCGNRGTFLRMTPDQKRLYVGGFDVALRAVRIPEKGTKPDTGKAPPRGGESSFVITPDGSHLVGHLGSLRRADKDPARDLEEIGKLDRHCAGVGGPDGGLYLAANPWGTLRAYRLPETRPVRSWHAGMRFSALAFDGKNRLLYAVTDPLHLGSDTFPEPGAGDLHIYDLSAPLAEIEVKK